MTSSTHHHVWPMHLPQMDLEVTLALIKCTKTQDLSLWLVHALPAHRPPHADWTPIKTWTKRLGNQLQLMFWRRVVTPEEWLRLLEAVTQTGTFPTNSQQIPLTVVERAPILLPVSADPALTPVPDEAAWLWEWWDPEKAVLAQVGEERAQQVNAHLRAHMGVDLNVWTDRIGNVLALFPTGVRMRMHHDPATRQLVVHTTLPAETAAAYEVEVRGSDGADLLLARRAPLERPSLILRDVPPCTRFTLSLWKGGQMVHLEAERTLIRGITMDLNVHVGSHGTQSYTRRATSTQVGAVEVEPWTRLQRERQVENRRAELARAPSLKFYAPDGTNTQRLDAVADLAGILSSARNTIRIWDPYFGRDVDQHLRSSPENDLYFLDQVSQLDVSIRVLSSTDDWTAAGGSQRLQALTTRLQAEHPKSPARFGRVAWRVWVRANDTAFHDRFLVIDDEKVWLLGSSMNGLGKKHTTLVQVEYPQEILVAFDRIWRGETHRVGQVLTVFEPQGGPRGP